jgi:hypothetical protein
MMIKNGIQNNFAFTGKERDGEKEGSRGPFASERGNGPYANFTPNQKIVYPQMMLDHAPIVPFGQNAANVWGLAQVGQPTTTYTIIIIKLF